MDANNYLLKKKVEHIVSKYKRNQLLSVMSQLTVKQNNLVQLGVINLTNVPLVSE